MRLVIYENIYNKERYISQGKIMKKFIDGVEYFKVFVKDTKREVFVRSDYLKKV